jgi:hypothetical protein
LNDGPWLENSQRRTELLRRDGIILLITMNPQLPHERTTRGVCPPTLPLAVVRDTHLSKTATIKSPLHFSGLRLVARNRGSRTHPFSAFVLGFAIRIRSEGFTSPLSSLFGRLTGGVTRPATLPRAGVQMVEGRRRRVVRSYVVRPHT